MGFPLTPRSMTLDDLQLSNNNVILLEAKPRLCIFGNLKFGEMKFVEMKRNTSNWSNFCMLLRRAGLTASAGLSCYKSAGDAVRSRPTY